MNLENVLSQIRVVLVRTSHPGNIGAAARAMKTMGLRQLFLVAPKHLPDEVAYARASGADDILDAATIVSSLSEALAQTTLSAAMTARPREWSVAVQSPRLVSPQLFDEAMRAPVALVFGTENSGLTNEEVEQCSFPLMIPTSTEYASLNLGAAVQLLCYEIRLAGLAVEESVVMPGVASLPASVRATHQELEGFYAHLQAAMTHSGFYDPANPRRLLSRVRRLFARTQLEKEEINILRGILRALEQKPD